MAREDTRTLLVGLDAATWDVVEPLLDEGELPNLAALLEDGVHGELTSTTPPMTPLAWTTMATGANPGKHGIYDFVSQDRASKQIRPTEYDPQPRPSIWDVFDAHDRRVGVINYPMVAPPRSVDGFFVSGYPAPGDSTIASPQSVQRRLDERDYRVHPDADPEDGTRTYYEDVLSLSETQCDVTIELLDEYDVDLLLTVFMAIDWVQHYLWDETIDGVDAVEQCYRDMDTILGRLCEAVGDEWTVAVVSDHGARPIEGEIHLNSLLAELDVLDRDRDSPGIGRRLVDIGTSTAYEIGKRLPDAIKRRVRQYASDDTLNEMREAAGLHQLDMHREIDWAETTAFAYGNMGRVFLDIPETDGEEQSDTYEGRRSELADRLASVTLPDSDTAAFDRVLYPEDVYTGERDHGRGDLVLVPRQWEYMLSGDFGEPWFDPTSDRVADHDPHGLYVIAGEAVATGTVDADIADITPTVLSLHDLPLVEGMDGSVIQDVFERELDPATRPVTAFTDLDTPSAGVETDGVEERLEDLGYL